MDKTLSMPLPAGSEPAPGVKVAQFFASGEFGWLPLEKQSARQGGGWIATEWNIQGRAVLRCRLLGRRSDCRLP